MRRAILFLLLAGCALGSTTSAQATVLYSVPANGTVIFTDDHVEYLGDIFGFGEGCFDWVSGCEQLSGSYQIVSPLMSLSLTQPDAQGTRISDYEFGAGTLVVWLGWTNPDGSQGSGQITAVVAPYSLFATEYSAPQTEGVFHQPSFEIRPGQIDVDLAKYLGVNTLLAGGAFEAFLLDGVSPGPEAPYRSGEIDTGQLTLVVPEPPLALLSLIGATASMWRRRGNQRAQRESITTAACRAGHGCMTVPRDARHPQRG